MNSYEKMINIIRKEAGRTEKQHPMKIGIMQDEKNCVVGNLNLDKSDFLVSSSVKGKLKKGDKVLVCRISDDYFAIIEKLEAM